MKRLTTNLVRQRDGGWKIEHKIGAADAQLVADHLATYEDTGLEPKRVAELAQAEKDGRLVVLPCKPGDKVKVDVNSWGNVWNYKIYDWGKFLHGEIVSISMTKKQFLMKIRVNHNVSWKRPMKRYPISALGKTVFPISAEAEAEQEGE